MHPPPGHSAWGVQDGATHAPFRQVLPVSHWLEFCPASGLHLCLLHCLHFGQGFCLEHLAAAASGTVMPSNAVTASPTATRREEREPMRRVSVSNRPASIPEPPESPESGGGGQAP